MPTEIRATVSASVKVMVLGSVTEIEGAEDANSGSGIC